MLIHLMQHGACMPKEIDPHQSLSPIGREQATKSAQAAQSLGLNFQLIATSRKTRAMQTAELMAENTGYPVPRIELTDSLKAMAPPKETISFIKEYQGLDSILLTGHLPNLGIVASALLVGSDKLNINIENAGLVQIDYDFIQESGILNWYLNPAQLAQIANN